MSVPGVLKGESISRTVRWLYALCGPVLLLCLAWHHFQLVTFELPLSYNEPSVLTITATLAEGGNPHSLESQPTRISVYPVLGNLVVVPFTYVFGNTLVLHRLVSAVFILMTCALVLRVVYRLTASCLHSLVAASICYAGLLYYSTPIASPNALGLFLFMASIAIPWLRGFNRGSLAVAVVAGVLAFYSKQYFVAGLGYVALYLFLSVSKQAGIQFGLSSLLAMLAVLVPVVATSPYFLDNTFFSVGKSIDSVATYETMLRQVRQYVVFAWPLLAALLLVGAARVLPGKADTGARDAVGSAAGFVDVFNMREPLLARGVNYFVLCLLCSTFIFAFSLGKNPGNNLTYIFQLVSPFLLLVIYSFLPRQRLASLLLKLLLVVGAYCAYDMLTHDFKVRHRENWQDIQRRISGADNVYANNIFLAEAMYNGLTIYNNAHTTYFPFAAFKPDIFKREREEETIQFIWDEYVRDVHRQVEEREFDLIILDQWTHLPNRTTASGETVKGDDLLRRFYRETARMPVSAARRLGGGVFHVRLWEPDWSRTEDDAGEPSGAAH